MSRSKWEADGGGAPAGLQVQVGGVSQLNPPARRLSRCPPPPFPPPPPYALTAVALHVGRLVRHAHAAYGCRPAGASMPRCTHAAGYSCTWMQMQKQYLSILWRVYCTYPG